MTTPSVDRAPRTEAGQSLLRWQSHPVGGFSQANHDYWLERILAIEAEAAQAGPPLDVELLAEVLHGFDCSDLTLRGVDWRWLRGDYGSELDRKIHLKEAEEIASRYTRLSESK